MVEIKINSELHTRKFSQIEWSGGIKGTSRTLQMEYTELNLALFVEAGDEIEFLIEGETIFKGVVFEKERIANKGTSRLLAYDKSIYLNKNRFVKNYFEVPPSEIVKEICGELNLEVGKLPQDKVKCTFPAIDKSGYEIILNAYTIQHNKDKEIYSVVCNDGKIEIAHQGIILEDTKLDSFNDIRESRYSQSIEEMINQIVVYKTENDKQQILDKVANEEDKKKYGIFQNLIEYNKDKDNMSNAKDMLKGLDNKANITVNGDINLQSGYMVAVEEHNTGLIGTFLIERDIHVFQNGDYFTNLELSFENTMDKSVFESYKAKKDKKPKKANLEWSVVRGEGYKVKE